MSDYLELCKTQLLSYVDLHSKAKGLFPMITSECEVQMRKVAARYIEAAKGLDLTAIDQSILFLSENIINSKQGL